jgi:osmotically-inducible protein OsmY
VKAQAIVIRRRAILKAMSAAAAAALVSACAPLVVVGVAGTALVATDRRSVGAQADDQAIELKVASNLSNRYGDRVHVNVTSYNGNVLLSGEIPDTDVRNAIVDYTKTTDRVRKVYDEMVVGPPTELSARTNDTYITSKVKSRFVEGSSKFSPTHVKVVTERSVVYLMGIVRRDEGDAAAQIASTTSGVDRVITLFEYIG